MCSNYWKKQELIIKWDINEIIDEKELEYNAIVKNS